MRRTIFSLVFASMMLTSCATIVFINGKEMGITPFETKLKRNENHKVSIKLEGYHPYEVELTKKFNEWYIGNILFGGIIGLVIDPITGAVYKLTPKEVNAELHRGTAFKQSEKEIYIAVSLEVDKNWKKVGQLEKM